MCKKARYYAQLLFNCAIGLKGPYALKEVLRGQAMVFVKTYIAGAG